MKQFDYDYQLIDTPEGLDEICVQLNAEEWIGIDTEFISEKRYEPLLCLIQIITKSGLFLIDTLSIDDLMPFVKVLQNPNVLKITHSGENDYRLFYQRYHITPTNLFDTQIAYGLISTDYPISLQRLVQQEANVQIPKGQTVTDWNSRPLSARQIRYALTDIYYLPLIWKNLHRQLKNLDRLLWAEEEFKTWENPSFFEIDLIDKTINHSVFKILSDQRKCFLLRLYKWRQEEARKKNLPVDAIVPEKILSVLAIHMHADKKAVFGQRHLPKKFLNDSWDDLIDLFQAGLTEDEVDFLRNIPEEKPIDEKYHTTLELVYWLIKYKCQQTSVAQGLLLRGNALGKLKKSSFPINQTLNQGWRKELLGDMLLHWLNNPKDIKVDWDDNRLAIKSTSEPGQ